MASALSELRFDDPNMLPGRMVNVAAHASLQLVFPDLLCYRLLERVLAEAERVKPEKPPPSVHLNVTRIAVLGDIGMELNAARFGAGQVRIEITVPYAAVGGVHAGTNQVITVLVFDSGKLIFTGGENEFVTQFAAWQFVYMLSTRFDIPATLVGFRINNIVFNFFLNFHVDLRRLQTSEDILCKYDPVEFPAVVYKFGEKFKALINYTGRVIITGARDRDTAHAAYARLYKKLLDFRVDSRAHENGARPALADVDALTESFMRMNAQFTAVMQTFSEQDIGAIDRAAPEFRLGRFVETCAKQLPALPAPSKRKRNE
jgi:TATA-box binding protein (TBP) (component of TFIID and TFIIIB)